jgi:hypothetical protein
MTIAISILTGSAVIFAADSRVTTQPDDATGTGLEHAWQAYDTVTKLAHDQTGKLAVMVVGHARVGEAEATARVSTYSLPECSSDAKQLTAIRRFIEQLHRENARYWKMRGQNIHRQSATLILAAQRVSEPTPRLFYTDLSLNKAKLVQVTERLCLYGSHDHVDALLLGYRADLLSHIANGANVMTAKLQTGTRSLVDSKSRNLPKFRLAIEDMPTQDAIDLAVFLGEVQVSMDRFLPDIRQGDNPPTKPCGGPIDVMVLLPGSARAVSLPGKFLHHPRARVAVTGIA